MLKLYHDRTRAARSRAKQGPHDHQADGRIRAQLLLSFATAIRPALLKKSPEQLEAELAKTPSKARAEVKRQVYHHGLDAPVALDGRLSQFV